MRFVRCPYHVSAVVAIPWPRCPIPGPHPHVPTPARLVPRAHAPQANKVEFDGAVDWARDMDFDYFAAKALENSYLLKVDLPSGERCVVERPQHMLLRVAVGIWGRDAAKVLETYELLSQGYFMHASPTLFNAGSSDQQLASSFLVAMKVSLARGLLYGAERCLFTSGNTGRAPLPQCGRSAGAMPALGISGESW